MVGCRKTDGINVAAVEDFAVVDVLGDIALEVLLRGPGENGLVDIAERDDPHAGNFFEKFNMVEALAVEADDGDADFFIHTGHSDAWKSPGRRSCGDRSTEEFAALE
jgi:hypothetical protein